VALRPRLSPGVPLSKRDGRPEIRRVTAAVNQYLGAGTLDQPVSPAQPDLASPADPPFPGGQAWPAGLASGSAVQ
jgi:hypothetical protein